MENKKVRVKVYLKSGQVLETVTYALMYSHAEFICDGDKMGRSGLLNITGFPDISVRSRYVVGIEFQEGSDG